VCYKNSSDDGASWSQLTLVASGASQPTIVCDQRAMTLILQFNVSTILHQTVKQQGRSHEI